SGVWLVKFFSSRPGDLVYHQDRQHQDATDLADASRLRHHRQGTEDLIHLEWSRQLPRRVDMVNPGAQ
ncbi:hypothetical protein L916_07258, partial [Phytophthora nicotianae]